VRADARSAGIPRAAAIAITAASLLLLVAAAGLTARIQQARIVIRWSPGISDVARSDAERRYGLVDSQAVTDASGGIEPGARTYLVIDPDRATREGIRIDPAIAALDGRDESAADALRHRLRVEPVRLSDWPMAWQRQSTILFAISLAAFAASFAAGHRVRAAVAAACAAAFIVLALRVPFDQPLRMGDYATYTNTPENFAAYFGIQAVRFEAHLSHSILRWLHRMAPEGPDAPHRAFERLAQLAACWHALMLFVAAWAGGFAPQALRYVAVVLALPASLMYFGFREFGYLSLNAAAFPLMAMGLARLSARFEAGTALAGVGAALHGLGALSLAGAAVAAASVPVPVVRRLRLVAQAFAWGTAAYLVWVFVYVVLQHRLIEPGHAQGIPWRPLFESSLSEYRVNWAVTSLRGGSELLLTCWIVGVALLLPACAAARGHDRRTALAFALPSLVFVCALWPIQGLAVEADLVLGAFPAVFALAWAASQSLRGTAWSLLLLVSSHVVFWRVMLGETFVSARVY
jgi:hypothetical protein